MSGERRAESEERRVKSGEGVGQDIVYAFSSRHGLRFEEEVNGSCFVCIYG
jgi:hypothetical protein